MGLLIKWKPWVSLAIFLSCFKVSICNRYQRLTINGETSDWLPILEAIPQESILGPLLLLIYFNDFPGGLELLAKLTARQLSNDLQSLCGLINGNDFQP